MKKTKLSKLKTSITDSNKELTEIQNKMNRLLEILIRSSYGLKPLENIPENILSDLKKYEADNIQDFDWKDIDSESADLSSIDDLDDLDFAMLSDTKLEPTEKSVDSDDIEEVN